MRRLILAAILTAMVAFLAPPGFAQDGVTMRAEVDRSSITLDDQIVLVVTIEGRLRSVEEPERPTFEDFDLYPRGRSQSMQIVNGEYSASNAFTYILVPKREGKFTIGPFTARLGGNVLRTEPITIDVGGGPGVRGVPAPASGEPAEREDRNVFVVARVDKQNAFVNEQILFTFYLYRAVQLSNLNYVAPDFQGFWVEKLKDSEKQTYKVLNGRRYLVTELSTALFPTTSGTLTIAPATLQVVELTNPFGFSLFDRGVERVLRTKAIDVQVSALPAAGRPPIFDGAVGEGLQLAAICDRTTVEEGEPITMTITVEGSGNVKTFSKPRLPDLPAFKTYDAESKTEATAIDRVYGKRTYEVVLVPRDEGEYSIGRIRMAYFDTREGRYRLLESNPLQVTALRSSNPSRVAESDAPAMQQEIQVTGRDLAHIHADLRVADDLRPLYTHGLFGVLAPLPLLAVAAIAVRQRRRDLLASDVALARSTRARKLARRHLAAAQKHLAAHAGEAFYAEVSRALLHYVGDKLNVSAVGATHGELRARVHAAGVSETLCERLVTMLERCDAARFAPGSMGGERLREVLAEAEGIIVDLDGVLTRRRSKAAAVPLAMLLLASAVVAMQPRIEVQAQDLGASDFVQPAELLRRGHAAYEAGKFAEAVEAYERAERAGVRTGALYYNLGNAYYRSEQLGKAIASYRRAERLTPRDRELHANLAHVLARREDKAMQAPAMPLIAAWNTILGRLSQNEWILVCAAFYVLASASIILALRGGRGWMRIARNAAIGASALLLVVTVAKVRSERVERGVVAVSRLPVTSGPGATYTTEFSLHEGADVRVESRRDDWMRISVNRTLRGWVPAASVLLI